MFAGKLTFAASPLQAAYSNLLGVGAPPQEKEDEEQQEKLRERFSQLSGLSGAVELSGAEGMLGAVPPLVKKWFPERKESEWDGLDEADQFTLKQQASAVEAKWNASINQYRQEGGCDATKPGRLAGALREYLIANGGEEANMGDDSDTFGPLECKEWMKIFNKQPDLAAAKESMKAGYGTVQTDTPTYGWRKIYLSDVCGSSVKLPVCPPPGGGAPPPPKPECDGTTPCPSGQECVGGKCVPKTATTSTKKSGLGLFVLAAGALGLAWVASRGQLKSAYGERPQKP